MLIDAHVHVAFNNLYNKKLWEAASIDKKIKYIKEILRRYKKYKISIVRDGGDGLEVSKLAREIAETEGMIYKSPIYAIYKQGHYGAFLGKSIVDVNSFKKEFQILLNNRLDHLKIVMTGMVSFKKYGEVGETAFSIDELKYMVETAKYHNIPVMIHANGEEGVKRAIEAGVDTIEHGYLISEAELYHMAEKSIIWIPTLAPLGNILASDDMRFQKERDVIYRVYDGQIKNIEKAMKIGTKIALGSDAGAYKVGHGSGLLDEIKHFERTGLSRQKIEEMCFENGAKALKL
ncbi:Amidohydrolase family protein [Anaerovirgula multivorans]|uniref:Amidohydrolase family protein n=1 Tax=Anaerovirgula multivorans TaxID=312168 RepID=A0A239GCE5_9FIRM|nr:amidohydrolase family protein [Anaerovirgula multivorans]SNS67006.1 Amidohydrolase family protein [Anaerovirgula multivorans]